MGDTFCTASTTHATTMTLVAPWFLPNQESGFPRVSPASFLHRTGVSVLPSTSTAAVSSLAQYQLQLQGAPVPFSQEADCCSLNTSPDSPEVFVKHLMRA